MLAAGVDGCLDFSLAALWGGQREDFGVTVGFSTSVWQHHTHEANSHNSTVAKLRGAFRRRRSQISPAQTKLTVVWWNELTVY